MAEWFEVHPGRVYAIATLLPLAAALLLLVVGGLRNLARVYQDQNGLARFFYAWLGGDRPSRTGAFFAIGCMIAATALAFFGLVQFLNEASGSDKRTKTQHTAVMEERWAESIDWIRIGVTDENALGCALQLGYRIDHLTALMFAMVTLVGTCIFIFSVGYMSVETYSRVTDHETHQTRRGRFGRFFLYLSLFTFSMLNLLIADNLFQVFVSWELVGVCSFFLIGFYTDRPKAGLAANKAFIMNRIGDAGFLIGLGVIWTTIGTFNFQEIEQRVRAPEFDSHSQALDNAGEIVRVLPDGDGPAGTKLYTLPGFNDPEGSHVALFPTRGGHTHGLQYGNADTESLTVPAEPKVDGEGVMPYWALVLAGIGIFLGCVGKSAQVPLHTWLPDAMEGPTPVSALIHAATMVAAGVYLVARVYPLFTPEVLMVIAYVGVATLFFGATVALVLTDIKRVLAYSTVSQLGYMMLALGVGAWGAALLHLLTHAFFKALLFLGAGSVIHACDHEQDMRRMGGLRAKMPLTAMTMLIGVLAIVGTPLFSGWYSKDQILSGSLGFASEHPEHVLLFVLPLVTAIMTGFYMFRLWFLTFSGTPRDEALHTKAHESPAVMTLPLIVLAIGSVGIAWGWPLWDVESSQLGGWLLTSEPSAVGAQFAAVHHAAEEYHLLAGGLALLAAAIGVGLAVMIFYLRRLDADRVSARFPGLTRFLANRWYIDEAYDAIGTEPTLTLARTAATLDKPTRENRDRLIPNTLDGLISAPAMLLARLGDVLRGLQTGRVRMYVAVLGLTTLALLSILTFLN